MSVYARVYDALTTSATLGALVGDHIYPIRAYQEAGYPAVVYRRASGDRAYDMSGYSTLENALIELAVHATAVTARRLVSDAAINAISSATAFRGIIVASPMDEYDDEVNVYTRTYEVSIWNKE